MEQVDWDWECECECRVPSPWSVRVPRTLCTELDNKPFRSQMMTLFLLVGAAAKVCADTIPLQSPQWGALMNFYTAVNCTSTAECPRFALSGPCDGNRLVCTSGRVTRIWLVSSLDLAGTIPTDIGVLTAITQLILSGNILLRSTLPSEILKLTALDDLRLDGTSLSGVLPLIFETAGICRLRDSCFNCTQAPKLCQSNVVCSNRGQPSCPLPPATTTSAMTTATSSTAAAITTSAASATSSSSVPSTSASVPTTAAIATSASSATSLSSSSTLSASAVPFTSTSAGVVEPPTTQASSGTIVGIVLGSIGALFLVALIVFLVMRSRSTPPPHEPELERENQKPPSARYDKLPPANQLYSDGKSNDYAVGPILDGDYAVGPILDSDVNTAL
jgi:hypothetical protein